DIDRACHLATARPGNSATDPRFQKSLTFEPPNINRTVIVRCVRPELPVSPATYAAHEPPQILPKSFGNLSGIGSRLLLL
ncbi:hypothetical protein, partial [Sulfitobacter litoralis]|uniref:hypothetical protein n=1 Tax=Sulfitobacter litoralis TaxID=335975 RepID=UPI001ABFDA97